jgi:hypothetical protein
MDFQARQVESCFHAQTGLHKTEKHMNACTATTSTDRAPARADAAQHPAKASAFAFASTDPRPVPAHDAVCSETPAQRARPFVKEANSWWRLVA